MLFILGAIARQGDVDTSSFGDVGRSRSWPWNMSIGRSGYSAFGGGIRNIADDDTMLF